MGHLRVVERREPARAVAAGEKLLAELARMEPAIKDAVFEFNIALAGDDVAAGVACVRRLVAVAGYLRDPANAAGAEL